MKRLTLRPPPQLRRNSLTAVAALIALLTGVLTVVLVAAGASWLLTFAAAMAATILLGWLAGSAGYGGAVGFVIAYSCALAVLLWPAVWVAALVLFGQGG